MQVPGGDGGNIFLIRLGWQKSPSSQSGRDVSEGCLLHFSHSLAFGANIIVIRVMN
jgi:hypothetical protein